MLNVLLQDLRDALTVKMGQLLKPGGRIFINVRSANDVKQLAKNANIAAIGNGDYYVAGSGSYQKGFTKNELKAYIQDALGDGYTVEITNKFGDAAVIVTKNENTGRYSVFSDMLIDMEENPLDASLNGWDNADTQNIQNEEMLGDDTIGARTESFYSFRERNSRASRTFKNSGSYRVAMDIPNVDSSRTRRALDEITKLGIRGFVFENAERHANGKTVAVSSMSCSCYNLTKRRQEMYNREKAQKKVGGVVYENFKKQLAALDKEIKQRQDDLKVLEERLRSNGNGTLHNNASGRNTDVNGRDGVQKVPERGVGPDGGKGGQQGKVQRNLRTRDGTQVTTTNGRVIFDSDSKNQPKLTSQERLVYDTAKASGVRRVIFVFVFHMRAF